MGSLVVFRDGKERNLSYIVDGQQRLTTITLALAAIRDQFDRLEQTDLADGVHNFVESKDLDNKRRFVLEHDQENTFLQAGIQNRSPDPHVRASSPEQEALQEAWSFLADRINSHAAQASDDEARILKLKRLRDRLLSLQFISIELENEDDAYLIFETLNTRGKDLQISDLVKNLFARLIKPKTKGMDVARSSWNKVLERLQSVNTQIEPDTFLIHYWLSREEYVSKASLFKAMKKEITASNAKSFLKDIEEASGTYTDASAPREVKWSKQELEVPDSLVALNIFRVAQVLPLVVSILRQYKSKRITLASVKRALKIIENFTFQFNAVTQSRGGGGIANMYAKLGQSVHLCDDSQAFASALKDIKEKLQNRVPAQSVFQVEFEELRFTSKFTRDRALVSYTLKKFAHHYGLPPEVDSNLYTIEHLMSESSSSEELVGSMGNLLFVAERVNQELKNRVFVEKVSILKREKVPVDPILEQATDWGKEQIEERARQLAAIAYREIWSIL